MLNINFVPDDYVQNNQSRKINLMYLVVLVVLMSILGGSFIAIKIRERAICAKEKLINEKMTQAEEAIAQFEQLQERRKEMMQTALTTAELLEPVPRSIILALLTNNLPYGTSLLELKLVQKEPKEPTRAPQSSSKYQAAKNKSGGTAPEAISKEKLLETYINIEGIAPSDLQVAAYIEQLESSELLTKVALVESKEYDPKNNKSSSEEKAPAAKSRQFKLTAKLKDDVQLTRDDVTKIAHMQSFLGKF